MPFVSLLSAVDAVMSSGGTMLREAAYLGIPAYSIFRSELGAVDRHLQAAGRLHFVERAADLDSIVFAPARRCSPRPSRRGGRSSITSSRRWCERA